MGYDITRNDILKIFNQTRFQLLNYACGSYSILHPQIYIKTHNRIFCPLENHSGNKNYIESENCHYTFTPGKLYFIPAYAKSIWRLDEHLKYLSIHTSLEIIPGIELFSNCARILEMDCPEEIAELVELHASKKEDLLLNSITVGGLVYSLQIQILKHYDASDFLGVTFLKKYNRLAEYLSSQVNAQTSVEDLAALYNLSRVAFTRNFTTETGITPKKLIDRYTLNRCLDLMNKGISSKEISSTLHFSNEFAFSRFFKRLTGHSPRNWKKERANAI